MRWVDLAVIRGTKDGFLVLLDEQADFSEVLGHLRGKLKSAGEFFRGSDMVVDVGERELDEEQTALIRQILEVEHHLTLSAIVHDSPARQRSREEEPSTSAPHQVSGRPEEPHTPRRPPQSQDQTLFVNRTLRNGQSIYHDGSVVIIGDVNPGAEVVATGDIIVLGTFRGVAHAGARGAEHAMVAALCLAPTQLRIAGYIGRAPDEGAALKLRPEAALVRDGRVVVEPCVGRVLAGN
ncbi:MAG: septum site-determining protein MinC [Armatimonadota bacterium]|nr:septum site-determining protein MinC [Armatimonadota bacterium]